MTYLSDPPLVISDAHGEGYSALLDKSEKIY